MSVKICSYGTPLSDTVAPPFCFSNAVIADRKTAKGRYGRARRNVAET